jgi:hypothetical protein
MIIYMQQASIAVRCAKDIRKTKRQKLTCVHAAFAILGCGVGVHAAPGTLFGYLKAIVLDDVLQALYLRIGPCSVGVNRML